MNKIISKLKCCIGYWKYEDVPDRDYTIINVGEGTGGGMMNTVHTSMSSEACGHLALMGVSYNIHPGIFLRNCLLLCHQER